MNRYSMYPETYPPLLIKSEKKRCLTEHEHHPPSLGPLFLSSSFLSTPLPPTMISPPEKKKINLSPSSTFYLFFCKWQLLGWFFFGMTSWHIWEHNTLHVELMRRLEIVTNPCWTAILSTIWLPVKLFEMLCRRGPSWHQQYHRSGDARLALMPRLNRLSLLHDYSEYRAYHIHFLAVFY